MGNPHPGPNRSRIGWGARLIGASTMIDRAFRAYDGLRSEVVLAFATEGVLDGFNNLIYGTTPVYRADSRAFRPHLFTWERRAVERFFPPPPARILIGGVGGGREAFALEARGYQVVAFEPAPLLVQSMLTRSDAHPGLRPLIGGYEQLPYLRCPRTDAAVDLSDLERFDAGVLGWASYSHLRTDEQRERVLNQFKSRVNGPILLSFFHGAETVGRSRRSRRLRRWLVGQFNQDPANTFSVHIGFYHQVSHRSLTRITERCGLRVLEMNLDEEGETWPHAVLKAPITAAGEEPGASAIDVAIEGSR